MVQGHSSYIGTHSAFMARGQCSYRGTQPSWPGVIVVGTQPAWSGVNIPTEVLSLHGWGCFYFGTQPSWLVGVNVLTLVLNLYG
jgi:hypothetical protein